MSTSSPKKRGRKPIGLRAMTSTERQRRSRALREASGIVVFSARASISDIEAIDRHAKDIGQTRADVVERLIECAVSKILP